MNVLLLIGVLVVGFGLGCLYQRFRFEAERIREWVQEPWCQTMQDHLDHMAEFGYCNREPYPPAPPPCAQCGEPVRPEHWPYAYIVNTNFGKGVVHGACITKWHERKLEDSHPA